MRNSCKDPMKRGAGRRGRNGRRRHRTARLAVVAGRGMRFSRVDAMQRGAGQRRRAVRVRTGRHGWRVRWGTECDFAQRPYAMGSGPAAPAWPGSDRTARLAGAAGHGMRFSRVDAMQRGAGQRRRAVRVRTGWHGWRVPAGHGTRFSCKDPMNPAPAAMVGARASSIPALTRKLTPVLRSSASARMGPSAKGQGPPSANTMKSRACRRALAPVVGRCGWTGSNSHFGPSGCHIVMAVPGLVSGTAIHRGTVLWGWPEQVRP
jgi:hypothetical protein